MPTLILLATPPPRARAGLRDLVQRLQRIDQAVFAAVADNHTPRLDGGLRRLTVAANYGRVWLACSALLATRGPRGRRAAATGMAAVAVTSPIVNVVLKPLGRRRRPDASSMATGRRAPTPRSTSFPSGHAASAFAFATAVATVAPREAIPIAALATIVAYSRVHAGVHYPADVLAGALLGSALGHVTAHALNARGRRPTPA